MLTALSVLNIVLASFMIGQDYEDIKQHQAEQTQIEQSLSQHQSANIHSDLI